MLHGTIEIIKTIIHREHRNIKHKSETM